VTQQEIEALAEITAHDHASGEMPFWNSECVLWDKNAVRGVYFGQSIAVEIRRVSPLRRTSITAWVPEPEKAGFGYETTKRILSLV